MVREEENIKLPSPGAVIHSFIQNKKIILSNNVYCYRKPH